VPSNRLKRPYTKRILAFCEKHNIAVPVGFHARNCYRFAIVDMTAVPNKLLAVTSYMESDVVRQLSSLHPEGHEYRILDFKRGRELTHVGEKNLTEIGSFEHELPNELKYLVEP
jgi:hypothetical protein